MLLNKELAKLGYVFKYKYHCSRRLAPEEEKTLAFFEKSSKNTTKDNIEFTRRCLYLNILNNTVDFNVCSIFVLDFMLYGRSAFVACDMHYNDKNAKTLIACLKKVLRNEEPSSQNENNGLLRYNNRNAQIEHFI